MSTAWVLMGDLMMIRKCPLSANERAEIVSNDLLLINFLFKQLQFCIEAFVSFKSKDIITEINKSVIANKTYLFSCMISLCPLCKQNSNTVK